MSLVTSFKLGGLTLKNRIVMAPLTRSRSREDQVPKPWNVEYYTQRSGAGLIITEATTISEEGKV